MQHFSYSFFPICKLLHCNSCTALGLRLSHTWRNFLSAQLIMTPVSLNSQTLAKSSSCAPSFSSAISAGLSFSLFLSFFLSFLPQIAVSHTTACGLWQGGVPVLRGSGVRLQLGRMGMLSCLQRLLSGRLWALISLHRQRLRSMTSSSLPSLWVCVEDGVVPPPTGGCPCASWASCWNCNCRWCCCWSCWSCCFNCSCCWWS